jgi:hypothetical protein
MPGRAQHATKGELGMKQLYDRVAVMGCKLGSSGCQPAACLDACSSDALLFSVHYPQSLFQHYISCTHCSACKAHASCARCSSWPAWCAGTSMTSLQLLAWRIMIE